MMSSPKITKRDSIILGMSSEDSMGTDSSFESSQDEVERENQLKMNSDLSPRAQTIGPKLQIEELKSKFEKHSRFEKRIKQKVDELVKDETNSKWMGVYYQFFNSSMNPSVTSLNEIALRCKFLYKLDKIERENKKRSNSAHPPTITPYTNLYQFMKYFSDKKYDKPATKFVLKTKSTYPQKISKKKESIIVGDSTSLNLPSNNNLTKRTQYNILNMYNIKEPSEVVANVNKKNSLYSKDEKTKKIVENVNYILNNKHAYQVEIDNFKRNRNIDEKTKDIFDTFLDLKNNENFFVGHTDVDLIKKYSNRLDEQEKIGIKINHFCNQVIRKIDPLHKLDFNNEVNYFN